MSYMPLEDLIEGTDSIYKLVVIASKRARQLVDGAPRLGVSDATKLTTIALEEIRDGAVQMRPEDADKEATSKSAKPTSAPEGTEETEEAPQVVA